MSSSKTSLFDVLMENIDYETRIWGYTPPTPFQPDVVASHLDNGTCRETRMRFSRILAVTSLAAGLRKRFIGATSAPIASSLDRETACINAFLASNARCKLYARTYKEALLLQDGFIWEVIRRVRAKLEGRLGYSWKSVPSKYGPTRPSLHCPLNIGAIAHNLRVGPGASSDVTGDAGTYGRLCADKISFSSKHVRSVYNACTLITPLTRLAEAVRYKMNGVYDVLDSCAVFLNVPKTNVIDRGICKQPSGNMALQLSTHCVLRDLLLRHWDCRLADQQEKNRQLAFLGSLGVVHGMRRSWAFCTLDLSEASNFPFVLIRLLFPTVWVKWLAVLRSSHIIVDGVKYRKYMCSTMGNGFTFSLMTLLLSTIVESLYELANLPQYDTFESLHYCDKPSSHVAAVVDMLAIDPEFLGSASDVKTSTRVGHVKTWAVYGDDIIVDRQVYEPLIKVLSALGFIVNEKKSFSTGLFRESCGGDFHDGYNVRPVFCETLQNDTEIFSVYNRLVLWGVYHSWPLPRSLSVLKSAIRGHDYRVPNWEDVSAGFHVPFTFRKPAVPRAVPLPVKKALASSSDTVFYDCLVANTSRRTLYVEKRKQMSWDHHGTTYRYSCVRFEDVLLSKREPINVPGILLCMLEGSVKSGRYGVRSFSTSYDALWRVAPVWGDVTLACSTAFGTRTDTATAVYNLWEEYIIRFGGFRNGAEVSTFCVDEKVVNDSQPLASSSLEEIFEKLVASFYSLNDIKVKSRIFTDQTVRAYRSLGWKGYLDV
jgi:hypothetical protein